MDYLAQDGRNASSQLTFMEVYDIVGLQAFYAQQLELNSGRSTQNILHSMDEFKSGVGSLGSMPYAYINLDEYGTSGLTLNTDMLVDELLSKEGSHMFALRDEFLGSYHLSATINEAMDIYTFYDPKRGIYPWHSLEAFKHGIVNHIVNHYGDKIYKVASFL